MWISFLALLINVPLNALFIYGYGPVQAMGAAGCGVATALVMWSMFAIGLIYVFRSPITRPFILLTELTLLNPTHAKLWHINWNNGVYPILKLGFPNAMALILK
ncbi:hypothetical protein [Thiomicrorhabdus aquaedulcis]|uniref:hypothetical protein n=1 Tax=Thiomicrorhabdus aquaedulcis TaxID=2211106 RepID=UPI001E5889C3|nr:hypothetical protein [Thiomicrorhabdus aquaedulcis]